MVDLIFPATLLSFWTLWYVTIVWTNLADLFYELRIGEKLWIFRSGNFAELRLATGVLGLAEPINFFLMGCVLFFQSVAAGGLAYVLCRLLGRSLSSMAYNVCFAGCVAGWGAFLIADGVFRVYKFTPVHMAILAAHIASFLAMREMVIA